MDPQPTPPHPKRETLLTLGLTVLFGAGFLAVLNFLTFGVLFHVAAAVVVIGLIGTLHYLLWGAALTQEVAGQREEEELRQRLEDQDESVRDRIRPRRF